MLVNKRGSIIKTVGLVSKWTGRWRKQLAQLTKYLRVVRSNDSVISAEGECSHLLEVPDLCQNCLLHFVTYSVFLFLKVKN